MEVRMPSDERRLVSVLFGDVVDSTALADGVDPEDVKALLRRYYDHAAAIMSAEGGRLEKFIGDAVVAVFGIPVAHGDDAERALRAGLRLHEQVRSDPVLGQTIRLRVGVHLGDVMVSTGESTSEEFLTFGDVMNTAARVQQVAEPGEVLASDRLYLATEDAFEFGDERIVNLKGKAGTFRVHPLRAARTRRRAERPPLAGRRHDLLQLRIAAERVIEEERSGLVTVLGEGGIGKTRLIEEFIASLPVELGYDLVTVDASRFSHDTSGQLRALLEGLLNAPIDRQRAIRLLADWELAPKQVEAHVARLLSALGSSDDEDIVGSADADAVIAVLRMFTDRLLHGRGVLVVIDSAEAAGDLLLRLVDQITTARGGNRVLAVVAAQPVLLTRWPSWGAGRDNHVSVTVQPLTSSQTRTLVDSYLPSEAAGLADTICDRSGGNPFYALEFVRLVEHQLAESTGSAITPKLPDNVHAAVLARLDALSGGARELLRVIAIARAALPRHLYQLVLSDAYSPVQIATGCDELLAQDLVRADDASRLRVRQEFVREIALSALSRADTIALLCAVADALTNADELSDGDEYSEVERHGAAAAVTVARHYHDALEIHNRAVVPAEFPAAADLVVARLAAAARIASQAGRALEAQEFVRDALMIAPLQRRVDLLELLSDVAWPAPIAATSIEDAIAEMAKPDLAGKPGRGETLVRLHRKLLILWLRCGLLQALKISREDVLARYILVHRLASGEVSPRELARLEVVDLFLVFDGECVEVRDGTFQPRTDLTALLARGCEIADWLIEVGDGTAASEALDGCQNVAYLAGQWQPRYDSCQRRLALSGLPPLEVADALAIAIDAHWDLADFQAAFEIIEKELANRRYGSQVGYLAYPLSCAVSVAYWAGEWLAADRFGELLARAADELAASPVEKPMCAEGFTSLLSIALAREDRSAANQFSQLLQDCAKDIPRLHTLTKQVIAREFRDAPTAEHADAEFLGPQALGVVVFCNERGIVSTPELIAAAAINRAAQRSRAIEVARALRNGDNDALAASIGDLEQSGLMVSAARLRIVYAARAGDRESLRAARATLDRLGDRRFLLRLAQVESVIGNVDAEPLPPGIISC
jgi:class 3 adenylate cyclase